MTDPDDSPSGRDAKGLAAMTDPAEDEARADKSTEEDEARAVYRSVHRIRARRWR